MIVLGGVIPETKERTLDALRWGLGPRWANDLKPNERVAQIHNRLPMILRSEVPRVLRSAPIDCRRQSAAFNKVRTVEDRMFFPARKCTKATLSKLSPASSA